MCVTGKCNSKMSFPNVRVYSTLFSHTEHQFIFCSKVIILKAYSPFHRIDRHIVSFQNSSPKQRASGHWRRILGHERFSSTN